MGDTSLPDFSFEKKISKKGFKYIAGVDEVGRGCFAGPVVAGCVVFDTGVLSLVSPKSIPPSNKPGPLTWGSPNSRHPSVVINDSKKLTPRQRGLADKWIKKNALWGVGEASVAQINRLGIKKATEIAFRKAIISLQFKYKFKIDFLLIDAFYIPYVMGLRRKNQLPIIHGDAKSFSIAAASIIAKVHRDKLMQSLSKKSKYRKYNWGQNKGYGTKEHQKAIQNYGITRLHRTVYVETWIRRINIRSVSSSQAQ